MKKTSLSNELKLSPIVHGHWRLTEWGLSNQELLTLIEQTVELGITSFDHADIYGNYRCEKAVGDAIHLKKDLRKKIQLITKCGIKLESDLYPERNLKTYDYSFEHIITSVENSLKNFKTDYIDLFLLHRPAPFFNPEDVAKAFSYLKEKGMVLHFGVSNFNSLQFEMLKSYVDVQLITNQVEISPYCLEHFENGNMDYFLKQKIKPMAWSPLAGGKIIAPENAKGTRILQVLTEIAEEMNVSTLDQIVYSWLLNHPAQIIPVIGTGKIERIKNAIAALNIKLNLEQWYKIYNASKGSELP